MTTVNLLDVAIKARERIARGYWTKGWYSSDTRPDDGRFPEDVRCCALGSVNYAAGGDPYPSYVGYGCIRAFTEAAHEARAFLVTGLGGVGVDVASFNDRMATSREDVLREFDKVIDCLSSSAVKPIEVEVKK